MAVPVRVTAADGYALGAQRYGDQSPGPFVVINSATGVKQGFYARFASWLSLQGFTVLTWDYRGIGESRPAKVRGFQARMRDWGQLDLEGVLTFADKERGSRPLVVVGHSIGGQLLGFAASNGLIERVVTVGSQSGSLRHFRGAGRLKLAATWYGVLPLVGTALGYIPGQLGIGEDLPAGIALEWARWGRHPDFFLNDGISRDGFERLRAPVRAISLWDDGYAPAPAVDWLHGLYSSAAVERVHLTARDVGAKSIGHFGFFRSAFEQALWPQVASFLSASAALRPVRALS